MPDVTFASKDAIPEELRGEAKEVDGKFVVNLVLNSKLAEFRDKNISVLKERETLKQRLDAVAPIIGEDITAFTAVYDELKQTAQKVKDGTLKGTEAVQKAISDGIEAYKKTQTDAQKALEQRAARAEAGMAEVQSKWRRAQVERAITEAATSKDSPVNPEALPDILSRAHSVFVCEDNGAIVAKNGDTVLYSQKDGSSPLPPAEWLVGLVKASPYLGKASSGGGAGGSSKGNQYGGLSQEAFDKLPAQKRIELHRAAQQRSA